VRLRAPNRKREDFTSTTRKFQKEAKGIIETSLIFQGESKTIKNSNKGYDLVNGSCWLREKMETDLLEKEDVPSICKERGRIREGKMSAARLGLSRRGKKRKADLRRLPREERGYKGKSKGPCASLKKRKKKLLGKN